MTHINRNGGGMTLGWSNVKGLVEEEANEVDLVYKLDREQKVGQWEGGGRQW